MKPISRLESLSCCQTSVILSALPAVLVCFNHDRSEKMSVLHEDVSPLTQLAVDVMEMLVLCQSSLSECGGSNECWRCFRTMAIVYKKLTCETLTDVINACAGDETLRFWNVFPGPKSQGSVNDSSVGTMLRTQIR